ncbi:esterase [Mitsuokella jalaludinii]|uniref:esterase n=1 Tax=Mitsuokella jalaludinii TaxID=187979 RepID=UPI0029E5C183|nr:esterase [Selenomonadaceae bacterium]
MDRLAYGHQEADIVLLQLVDDHDLTTIEQEVALIREYTGLDFLLLAFKTEDWNQELSPWKAPAVFGRQAFGGGAEDTLREVLASVTDRTKRYYIGGYSLAGLFALWAAYRTELFSGVAAASPSLWFPGFTDFMKEQQIRSRNVYLSLGDKEERARNPVMATVGACIRDAEAVLRGQGVHCVLEWNKGNHFQDVAQRTAKAFAWGMKA